ncbi:MAG: photosystem II stability/assembly factor-like uncharacterized protein [Saprospiraceae bacterium]|jgi:photosystem II stability/assembly factor-like uncharacterized protein
MKKIYLLALSLTAFAAIFVFTFQYVNDVESEETTKNQEFGEEEGDKRTRVDDMLRQDFELTKDLSLGYPPRERLLNALNYVETTAFDKNTPITDARWIEHGPYSVGGRTRTILIDKNDPTGKAAFAASVSGGIWYTKDILTSNVKWEPINDYLDNLAIVTIAQDENNPQIMYFGTGEGYPNADAVRGLGIWKSTDGGVSWNHLTVTSSFQYVMRMVVHSNGDIYAATDGDGLQRSQDAGQTWTRVLGSGVSFGSSNGVNDIELGPDGSIWAITGFGGGSVVLKSEGGIGVGDIGNWSRVGRPSTGLAGGQSRMELAAAESNPNIVYALCSDNGAATFIYKTIDGGQSWIKASDAPSITPGNGNFAGDQAWYDLDIEVDPNNANRILVGGIDVMMSTTGGTSWAPVTSAYNPVAPYIHPDQHFIYFYPGSSKRLFIGNDGGIYRSDNADQSPNSIRFNVINDRYNVTQFYAVAIHPGFRSNYFLAGSQDNGTHQFKDYLRGDLDVTLNIWGGDGMICHIDQTDGMIQLSSSQYGNYGLSTDGGENFSGGASANGAFVNPSDYDDEANILYAQTNSGGYFRWDVSQFGGGENVTLNASGNLGTVRHLKVSPNVPNRLYLGTSAGRVIKIDDAHTGTNKIITQSSVGGGSISSIAIEKGNENHMLTTVSNYGSVSIHESFDNGSTWQSVEGNLPDMPVRWVIFDPIDSDQAMIATEMGVWVTDNLDGNSTIWQPSFDGLPTSRVNMLEYRESDNLIVAATYGRGLFTTAYRSPASSDFKVDRIGYLGTPFLFKNTSYNPNKIEWSFGDNETSTDFSPTHIYNQLGTYTATLTINDTLTTSQTILILPNRTVPYTNEDNAQYDGSFENNAGDFGVYTISGTGFELGNSTISPKSGTKTGSKAYVTGITENYYQNNSTSMLYTPNYDLSQEGIYELSFWAKYDLQFGWDGFLVEYSTDLGTNWAVLGGENDDWYNYTNSNQTAFASGSAYITGSEGSFTQYKKDLSSLVGNENVAFRIVFKTNAQGVYRGVAIDDFQVRAFIGQLETRLISFDAEFIDDQKAEVTWSTVPEYECDGFDLELSENGRDFTFFGNTDGQGSSINLTNYNVRPNNLKKDLYFFRLKVNNFDGSFFYSDIVVLQRRQVDLDIINIFPNPFIDNIGFTFNNIIDEPITINLYDAAGKLVYTETGNFTGIYKEIETKSYAKGVYILQVIVGNEQFARKLLRG